MADLIDRAALLEKLELLAKYEDAFRETVIRGVMFTIRSETAVDAVEVVRCKDCKSYEDHKRKIFENCVRNGRLVPMQPNDFCSYGERKET